MKANAELRAALLRKMGWDRKALHARVAVRKRGTPMSTGDAVHLIAHEHGISVDRFLEHDEIARVRSLVTSAPLAAPSFRSQKAVGKITGPREIRFPGEFRTTDPLLDTGVLKEAAEMAAVYPLLYVLENSMREVVMRVMTAKHGADWWDAKLNNGKAKEARDTANKRRASEKAKLWWHQRRGAHQIYYIDLSELGSIVTANQSDFFPDVIPDREWFLHLMRELEPSRNVVCHMNPLAVENITDVRGWVRKWNKTVADAIERGALTK